MLASYDRSWIAIIFIIGFSTVIYANSLWVPFQYDDSASIVSNPAVHLQELSISGLKNTLAGNRPVSNLTFAINYYLGDSHVLGYHLVNLVIHSLTGCAVYFFFSKILGPSSRIFALLGALLWATHPIQTQAVTYISQRMASLATLFFMWSVVLYIVGRACVGAKRAYAYGASLLLGLLAVGSKEMAATLPVILLLHEYYFLSGLNISSFKENWRHWLPLLLAFLAIVTVYVWFFVLEGSLSIGPIRDLFSNQYVYDDFNPQERLLTEFRVVMYYLSLLILPLPSRLNIYHDFPVSTSLLMPVSTLFSIMGILGMLIYAVKVAKRYPVVSYGIFWFLINLTIESFLFRLDLIFEHRLYLPSIGFFLIIVWLLKKVTESGILSSSRFYRLCFWSLCLLVLGLYSSGTIQRNSVWQAEVTLWKDAAQKSPNSHQAHNGLGAAYARSGQFELAIEEFRKALILNPSSLLYRIHLGQIYEKVGNIEASKSLFEEAVRLDPSSAGAYYYLGKIYYTQNALSLAEEALRISIKNNPVWAPPYNLLGTVYQKQDKWVEAAVVYEQLLQMTADRKLESHSFDRHPLALPKMTPDKPIVHYQLGKVYEKLGQGDQAAIHYQETIREMPYLIPVRLELARLYADQRKFDLSEEQYMKILEVDPNIVEVYFNLAIIDEMNNNPKEAAIHYQRFLDSAPETPVYAAHRRMAQAWLHKTKNHGTTP